MAKNNETKQVMVPVLVDRDSIKEHGRMAGMDQYKITRTKVGNRVHEVMLVPGTKEQYDAVMAGYSREFKAEDRAKRCKIPGKNGKLMRCPDGRKCDDCEFSKTRESCRVLTFSELAIEGEDGEMMEFDPEAPANYNSDERCTRMLNDFISFACDRNPDFKSMIELLVDGNSSRQVAKQMGIPKSTVIDRVKKLRGLWDEFTEDLSY